MVGHLEPDMSAGGLGIGVRRSFRRFIAAAGRASERWTPRELTHRFVPSPSAVGTTIEKIAELCGHAGARVTEAVYRHPAAAGPAPAARSPECPPSGSMSHAVPSGQGGMGLVGAAAPAGTRAVMAFHRVTGDGSSLRPR